MRLQTVFAVLLVLVSSWPPLPSPTKTQARQPFQNQTGAALWAEIANVRQKLSGEMPRHNTRLASRDTWLAPVFPQDRKQGAQWYDRSGGPRLGASPIRPGVFIRAW